MRLPTQARRRTVSSAGASSVARSLPWLWGLCGIVCVGLFLAFSYLQTEDLTGPSQLFHHRRLQAGGLSILPLSMRRRDDSIRRSSASTRFASIFHTELSERFKYTQGRAAALTNELVATLKEMEAAGITTAVFSTPWDYFSPEENTLRYDYLDWVVDAACQNTKLKVSYILDMVRAPNWVYEKFPDAKAMDSHGREYPLLSWFHADAQKLALSVLADVTSHLVTTHRECVTSIQPVFNNEYEAKYTQERDCYQDYSPPAMASFRTWLQERRPRLEELNARWGTSFATWPEVVPSVLEAGSFLGVDLTPRYWDFLKFREVHGAEVFNRACAAVQMAGALCFHHVPEFFTVLDAVYGASMFKHIAASPHTDFIIIDSNFRTPYGTVMNPSKLRLFVSAAQSYGKPVHFEAAVERFASLELLESGFRHALMSGASGLGITNWLSRVEMNTSLAAALAPAPPECGLRAGEVVGVFIHLDSCAAWHGLQWGWSRKDPLHDFVQDLADTLTSRCDTDVSVYMELDRFYNALPGFDRVVFVEPIVLFGTAELDAYALVKASIRTMPHTVMHLPANQTNGVQLTVLQDL